jgi:ferredoxin
MTMRVRVNPIACDGHALCAELLPELFRLDDWGYPILDAELVPTGLQSLARMAADACPTLAIVIEDERKT